MRRASLRSGLVAASLICGSVLLASCSAGDGPAGPPPVGPPAGVRLVSGLGQRAFAGEQLQYPVIFQVVDRDDQPVTGAHDIQFAVADPTGSTSVTRVTTNAKGQGGVFWRLGASVGAQTLSATLAGVSGAAPATLIQAESVSPADADVVIVQGAVSGTIGILINVGGSMTSHSLTWPDTVLRLLPRGPAPPQPFTIDWEDVSAFSTGRSPAASAFPWSDGVDSVRLALRAPIEVPFVIWVADDFDATAARANYDLANLDAFWRSRMFGLQVGDVRIEYAAELEGTTLRCGEAVTGRVAAAINVYYARTVDNGNVAVTCAPDLILMGASIRAFDAGFTALLAHEVGHAMSLGHQSTPGNMMSPSYPWLPGATVGQIYRMHFHDWGALNSVLGVRPTGMRNCDSTLTPCPAQAFDAFR